MKNVSFLVFMSLSLLFVGCGTSSEEQLTIDPKVLVEEEIDTYEDSLGVYVSLPIDSSNITWDTIQVSPNKYIFGGREE